jgi:hypothetical protein
MGDLNVYETGHVSEIIKEINSRILFSCFVLGDNGWKNSPIWAHYGESGYGICIGLNEKKINDSLDLDADIKHIENKKVDKVDYDEELQKTFTPPDLLNYESNDTKDSIQCKIWNNIEKYYFKKDKMWNYENEYRILTIGKYSDPLFIDIKDAIEEIIFGDQVSNLAIPEDKIFKKYPSVKLYKLVYEYAYNRINRVPIMPKAAGN